MRLLGIEFAPFCLPFERRLQTLCLLILLAEVPLAILINSILLILFAYKKLFFFIIIYFTYLYLDRNTPKKGGRKLNFLRNLKYFHYVSNYFPIKVIKTADIPKDKNYIFCVHPHGIISISTILTFCYAKSEFYKHFPELDIKVATLNLNFKIPLHRDYILGLGFCSANRDSIEHILEKQGLGQGCAVVVGGALEALDAKPNQTKLCIKNRKGCMRIALSKGSAIVPVFQFGENNLYKTYLIEETNWFRIFQKKFIKIFTFSLPIFYGRGIFQYTFGLLPYRKPLTVVIGEPILVEKIQNPTEQQVDELHDKYIKCLTNLYNKFNSTYGNKKPLIII